MLNKVTLLNSTYIVPWRISVTLLVSISFSKKKKQKVLYLQASYKRTCRGPKTSNMACECNDKNDFKIP